MPATIAAARAGATTGEWAQALRDVFGEYRAPTGVGEAAARRATEDRSTTLRDEVERVAEALGRRLKILVGKPGLDGHSNGAEQIAVRARDVGMEVVYEGIRLTPSQIAASALQEGVHVIGLSILWGSHRELIPARHARPCATPASRRRSSSAGSSPRPTRPLRAAGVAAVYTPKDFDLTRIMGDVVALVAERTASPPPLTAHGRRAEPSSVGACARGDLAAAPAVLNLVESRSDAARAESRRAAARGLPRRARRRGAAPTSSGSPARPGVGKSTLLSELVARVAARAGARSPCSPSTPPRGARGARCWATARASPPTRATTASFIRSTAAGGRLGGLAPATRAAAQALAAAFDVVVVETVGVGQYETDVADVADTVAVVVQPGSGDVLQFLKAGIMEIPDVLVVTKADLGDVALRARRDLTRRCARWARATTAGGRRLLRAAGEGIDELVGRARRAPRAARHPRAAAARPPRDALADFAAEHGERGLRAVGGRRAGRRLLRDRTRRSTCPRLVAVLERRRRPRDPLDRARPLARSCWPRRSPRCSARRTSGPR